MALIGRMATKTPTLVGRMATGGLNSAGIKAFTETPYGVSPIKKTEKPKAGEVMRLEVGEGLDKTLEVLPGPRIATLEAIERGEDIKIIPNLVGRMAKPLPAISPYGIAKGIVRKEALPVGIDIKVPFTQRAITIPADTIGELTKQITELPEKVYQSLSPSYTEEIKRTGKIPQTKEIYNVITYQEDLQDLINNGYSPLSAFVLVGSVSIIDTAILGSALKPIVKQIAKIPVSTKTIQKLTWDDLFRITKGEILSVEKMAAFNKASQEGVDWIKLLKEKGGIESVIKQGKTLGQWVEEQFKVIKLNEAGFAKTPNFVGRMKGKIRQEGQAEMGLIKAGYKDTNLLAQIEKTESITKAIPDELAPLAQEAGKLVFRGTMGKGEINKILAGNADIMYQKNYGSLWAETPKDAEKYARGFSQATGMAGRKPIGNEPFLLEGKQLADGSVIPIKATNLDTKEVIDFSQAVKEVEQPKPLNLKALWGTEKAKEEFRLMAEEFPEVEQREGVGEVLKGIEEKEIMETAFADIKQEMDFYGELENQYQQFKQLRLQKLDEIEGAAQLKNIKADKKTEIDNILYHQEKTGDEVFDMFKERLLTERNAGKEGMTLAEWKKKLKIRREKTVRQKIKSAKTEGMVKGYELGVEEKISRKGLVRKETMEKAVAKVKSPKEILDRRRAMIRTARDHFGLTDNDLKKITRKDIRLMSTFEFKNFIDDIRVKAGVLAEQLQAKNELLEQIKRKNLNIEPLRKAMKLPKINNMTTSQLRDFDKLLQPYHLDDIFLSKRKLETIDRTELEGIKTYREATERLAKKIGIRPEELGNIKVSEFDRFRGDTALTQRNPFYKMMVEETAKLQFIRDVEYLDIEKQTNKLAGKLGLGKRFELIPRQKNIAEWFDAENKKDVRLNQAEVDLISFMMEELGRARDYLIKIEAMKKGIKADSYYHHTRRGILEAVVEDGPIKAAKEVLSQAILDEQGFNITDSRTGEILAYDKFFGPALHRTGALIPTKNIVRSFLTYMKTFKKKQALDVISPLIDIYAHALTPKGMTKTGVLLHGNLIQFTKEWLNTQKGRKVTLLAKQGGKIDLALRGMRNFLALLYLGGNIPVTVATQVGEQVITYKLLGKWKWATSKIKSLTPRGRRIRKKYTAFIGKNPWLELLEPAKGISERFNMGIFSMFQDANVRRTRNFLLGSLTKAEWKAETISPERIASLRTELGRYGVVPGAKSIYGATSVGGAFTQFKTWALPILRSELQNVWNLHKLFTANKAPGKRALLDLYRTLELVVIVSIIRSFIGDEEEDDSMISKIKARFYMELSTIWQALSPDMFLSIPVMAKYMSDLGKNLTSIIKLEEYQQSEFGDHEAGELMGVNRLIKQFTPRAIKQFEKENIKTPDDVREELIKDIESGRLDLGAAKEKLISELKKIEAKRKKMLFGMSEENYKKDLTERIKENSITVQEAKLEVEDYIKANKEKIIDKLNRTNEKTFINQISLYAKALGTDPITAFNRILTGQRIRRLDNGTIIVERMELEESQAVKKARGATKDMILDHTIPLQLGGGNSEKNLKLVPIETWKAYTIIENYLGDLLRAGEIDKKKAQQLIQDYKNNKIVNEDVMKIKPSYQIKENYLPSVNLKRYLDLPKNPSKKDIKMQTEYLLSKNETLSQAPSPFSIGAILNLVREKLRFLEKPIEKRLKTEVIDMYKWDKVAEFEITKADINDTSPVVEPVLHLIKGEKPYKGVYLANKNKIETQNLEVSTTAHELLHMFYNQRPLLIKQDYGRFFNEWWDYIDNNKESDPDTVHLMFDISNHIQRFYLDLSEEGTVSEYFAFLGQHLGTRGLSNFPKPLRKYYKGIFN